MAPESSRQSFLVGLSRSRCDIFLVPNIPGFFKHFLALSPLWSGQTGGNDQGLFTGH